MWRDEIAPAAAGHDAHRIGVKTHGRCRRRQRIARRRSDLLGGDFGHFVVEDWLIWHRRAIGAVRRDRTHADASQIGIRSVLRDLEHGRIEFWHAEPWHCGGHGAIARHAALWRHGDALLRRGALWHDGMRFGLLRRRAQSRFVDEFDGDIAESDLVARLDFLLINASVVDVCAV